MCTDDRGLIGYGRRADRLRAGPYQRSGPQLAGPGVDAKPVYVDHGTGTDPDWPGLREPLAACLVGDMLVVTNPHLFAQSLRDARAIADALTATQAKLHSELAAPNRCDGPNHSRVIR